MQHQTFMTDPLNVTADKLMIAPSLACRDFCQDIIHRLGDVVVPFLTLHSPADDMVDFDSSVRLYADAGSEDKTFLVVEDGHHSLLTEAACADWVRQQIVEWLSRRS